MATRRCSARTHALPRSTWSRSRSARAKASVTRRAVSLCNRINNPKTRLLALKTPQRTSAGVMGAGALRPGSTEVFVPGRQARSRASPHIPPCWLQPPPPRTGRGCARASPQLQGPGGSRSAGRRVPPPPAGARGPPPAPRPPSCSPACRGCSDRSDLPELTVKSQLCPAGRMEFQAHRHGARRAAQARILKRGEFGLFSGRPADPNGSRGGPRAPQEPRQLA